MNWNVLVPIDDKHCRICGSKSIEKRELVEKDVHGCQLKTAEWINCNNCKVSRISRTWEDLLGCLERWGEDDGTDSATDRRDLS